MTPSKIYQGTFSFLASRVLSTARPSFFRLESYRWTLSRVKSRSLPKIATMGLPIENDIRQFFCCAFTIAENRLHTNSDLLTVPYFPIALLQRNRRGLTVSSIAFYVRNIGWNTNFPSATGGTFNTSLHVSVECFQSTLMYGVWKDIEPQHVSVILYSSVFRFEPVCYFLFVIEYRI